MTPAPSIMPTRARRTEESSPDITAQVQSEQLASLYDNTVSLLALGLIFSLLPVLLLWPHLPPALLLGCLSARGLMAARRYHALRRYRAAPPRDLPRGLRRHLALLALDGLSWGAMGALFHTPALPQLEGVLLASTVAIGAIGLFARGSVFRANLLFSGMVF